MGKPKLSKAAIAAIRKGALKTVAKTNVRNQEAGIARQRRLFGTPQRRNND